MSASRPDWGLVLSQGTGHNQAGELVYEFNGAGFVERKGRYYLPAREERAAATGAKPERGGDQPRSGFRSRSHPTLTLP